MSDILIKKNQHPINATIRLDGSKSISNRVQIIQALCDDTFDIQGLSTSDDSNYLKRLLVQSSTDEYNCGHAGTTYRFMTAYLSLQSGTQILTGSERMKERPIGPLVNALRSLGAKIDYLEKEGFPPLSISSPDWTESHKVSIDAGISSQYLSALLLIAPTLPQGLTLSMQGEMVSKPYLQMTLNIMHHFGIEYSWIGQDICIKNQIYKAKDFVVEADWSAASYFYSVVALSPQSKITLQGVHSSSIQGDAQVAKIYENLGIKSEFDDNGDLHLSNNGDLKSILDYNFVEQPDLAQSVSVSIAGLGMQGLYTGLQTLRIKETDRIAALQTELAKVNVYLNQMPSKFSPKSGVEYYMQEGKAQTDTTPTFATYKDHRMAMAFAPLALMFDIQIEKSDVVTKSYPKFWEDFAALGFEINIMPNI